MDRNSPEFKRTLGIVREIRKQKVSNDGVVTNFRQFAEECLKTDPEGRSLVDFVGALSDPIQPSAAQENFLSKKLTIG
jgi:hypothetical protein